MDNRKIKYVAENECPPCGNSNYGFNFDPIFVVIVSFCTDLQNFVKTEPRAAEL